MGNPDEVDEIFKKFVVNILEIIIVLGIQVVEDSEFDNVVDGILEMHEITERLGEMITLRQKIPRDIKDVVRTAKREIK